MVLEAVDILANDSQFERVFDMMLDGEWRTPREIRAYMAEIGYDDGEAAITARLRDFRKIRFGNHRVGCRRRAGTRHFEYKLEI